jgi:hypothetical protein
MSSDQIPYINHPATQAMHVDLLGPAFLGKVLASCCKSNIWLVYLVVNLTLFTLPKPKRTRALYIYRYLVLYKTQFESLLGKHGFYDREHMTAQSIAIVLHSNEVFHDWAVI